MVKKDIGLNQKVDLRAASQLKRVLLLASKRGHNVGINLKVLQTQAMRKVGRVREFEKVRKVRSNMSI